MDEPIRQDIVIATNRLMDNYYNETQYVSRMARSLIDNIINTFLDNRIRVDDRKIEEIVMEQIYYINNVRKQYQIGLEDTSTHLQMLGKDIVDEELMSSQVSKRINNIDAELGNFNNNYGDMIYEIYPVIARKYGDSIPESVMDDIRSTVRKFQNKFEEGIQDYRIENIRNVRNIFEQILNYVDSKVSAQSKLNKLDSVLGEQLQDNLLSQSQCELDFNSIFYKEFIDLTRNIVGAVNTGEDLNLDEVHNLYSKFVSQVLPTFKGDISQFYQLINSEFVPNIVSRAKEVCENDSVKLENDPKTVNTVLKFSDQYNVINTERVFEDVRNIVFSQYNVPQNDPRYAAIVSEIQKKKKILHDISYEREKEILVENVSSVEEKSNNKLNNENQNRLCDFFL